MITPVHPLKYSNQRQFKLTVVIHKVKYAVLQEIANNPQLDILLRQILPNQKR